MKASSQEAHLSDCVTNTTSVPPRHKRTELGLIPADWGCDRMGDLVSRIGSGITPTGGERVYKTDGHPFIRSQNVGWGELRLDDLAFIDEITHASFSASEIQEGDVLLNITGASIGRSSVADIRVAHGNVNQHVCEIRPDRRKLDPHYLSAFLLSTPGQRQVDSFQAGGNRQGLNYNQVRSFLVPLPPLPEQRAIAAVLSDVDALISALDRLIAKKRAIKQVAMQELLTGKTRLPGFKGKWVTMRFGDLFQFLATANNSRADLSEQGDVGYVHYGDIHTRAATILDCWRDSLPRIDSEKVASVPRVEDGDLVMVDASEDYEGIGKTVEIVSTHGRHVVAGLHTFLLRGDRGKLADGFKRYLQFLPSVRQGLIRTATGISVYGVSKSNVRDVQISLPLLTEQRAIAAALSDMDDEIGALERRRDKTRAIKQGMMQELLTGRIRLVKPSATKEATP